MDGGEDCRRKKIRYASSGCRGRYSAGETECAACLSSLCRTDGGEGAVAKKAGGGGDRDGDPLSYGVAFFTLLCASEFQAGRFSRSGWLSGEHSFAADLSGAVR